MNKDFYNKLSKSNSTYIVSENNEYCNPLYEVLITKENVTYKFWITEKIIEKIDTHIWIEQSIYYIPNEKSIKSFYVKNLIADSLKADVIDRNGLSRKDYINNQNQLRKQEMKKTLMNVVFGYDIEKLEKCLKIYNVKSIDELDDTTKFKTMLNVKQNVKELEDFFEIRKIGGIENE